LVGKEVFTNPRKPIYFFIDSSLKKDLTQLASEKKITVRALIESATIGYLTREVEKMKEQEQQEQVMIAK